MMIKKKDGRRKGVDKNNDEHFCGGNKCAHIQLIGLAPIRKMDREMNGWIK